MRSDKLLLTGLLLMAFFISAFLANPCVAASEVRNNITLERDGVSWEYQEQITGNEAVFFRNFIDVQAGNENNFVNAWEILKAETVLSDQTKEAVEARPDVRINGTSKPVKVKDVDFWLSKEALGRVDKNSSITNSASVSYIFEKEIGQDTEIWLIGTSNSSFTINLPVGFDIEKTAGLDNRDQKFLNNCTVLKGSFGPQKNITLWISENESSKARLRERREQAERDVENGSKARANKAENAGDNVETRQSSELLKDIFEWFI